MRSHWTGGCISAVFMAALSAWLLGSDNPAAATVEVLVRPMVADGGKRQADLYLAVASSEGAAPEVEVILPPGVATAKWRLLAGRHYWVRGGGQDGWCRAAIEVSADIATPVEVTCELAPLGRLDVALRDKTGEPVPGAAVGAIWALAPPPSATALSIAAARQAFSRMTDENGAATLRLPRAEVVLLAELLGRGVALTPALPGVQTQLVPMVLHSGGSLDLVLAGAAEIGDSYLWLRPHGRGKERGSLYRAFPLSFWRRRVADGRAHWPALLAGEYDVYLDGDQLARAGKGPQVLGSATVVAGESVGRELSWPGIDQPAAPAGEPLATLYVPVRLPEASRLSLIWPRQRRWKHVPYTAREEGGGTLLAATSAAGGALWVISTPESIAAPVAAAAGRRVEVGRLAAAGRVAGTLVPEGKIAIPRQAVIRFSSPDGAPEFMVPAEVQEAGYFEAPSPAGRYRMQLEAPGVSSEPLSECLVAPGQVTVVPSIPIRREAEALTRVVDADTSTPLPGVTVVAVAAQAKAEPESDPADRSLSPACVTDGDGWCRIGGLATWSYRLQACHPGYACATGEVFGSVEGTLVETEDLKLSRAATVRVVAGGVLPAKTQVWVVPAGPAQVGGAGSRFTEVVDGSAVVTGVPPGTSLVQLVVVTPEGLGVRVAQTQVCLAAGEDRFLDFGAGTLTVHGRLTDHGVGVPGHLVFHPGADQEAGSFLLLSETDGGGRFTAHLPEIGKYTVDVEVGDETVQIEVTVVADEELALALPGGSVRGRVVDSQGRAVSGADVTASGATVGESPRFAERRGVTDQDGAFRLTYLDNLSYEVVARKGELRSKVVRVPVADAAIELPALVVESADTVSGRVVDEGGRPLGGAQVTVVAAQATDAGPLESRELTADAQGVFKVPAGAASLNLIVSSPGHGVRAFRTAPRDGLVVTLLPGGGTIRLEGRPAADLAQYLTLVSGEDGGFLLPFAFGFAAGNDAYVIPNLGAGTWIAVRSPAGYYPSLLKGLVRGFLGGWQVLAQDIRVTPGATTRLQVVEDRLVSVP